MLHVLALLIFTYCVDTYVVEKSNYKLELVQAFFRHGDRILDLGETYPKDPYNASEYEPYIYGQLTAKGQRREYEIGQMLRKRYGSFLSVTYKSQEVYAYSTDKDRTKMSLQLVLAGLYPPSSELKWNAHLDWIPIPADYNPRQYDFLSTSEQCPEFEVLFNRAAELPEVQEKLLKYKNVVEYLSNNTGLELSPAIGTTLYHAIRSQRSLGLPFPSWCNETIFEKLEELTALRFDVYAYTNFMNQIGIGPTIKRFLRNIEESESKSSTRKIYLYSAHDSNVVPFLRAHNFSTPRTVDYGSTVILEKLRGVIDNKVYVRLVFWSGVGAKLSVLKLNDCEEYCPLSEYIRLVSNVLPNDDGIDCLITPAFQNIRNVITGRVNNTAVNARRLNYVSSPY